jgi:hypothetical protein
MPFGDGTGPLGRGPGIGARRRAWGDAAARSGGGYAGYAGKWGSKLGLRWRGGTAGGGRAGVGGQGQGGRRNQRRGRGWEG